MKTLPYQFSLTSKSVFQAHSHGFEVTKGPIQTHMHKSLFEMILAFKRTFSRKYCKFYFHQLLKAA